MEAFVATDNEQFEVIKKVIDLCDYYVLIIGKRYGSVSSLTGKSYTEMEYDYAKSKDIPILVFAIDTNVVIDENKVDTDAEKVKLLELFRTKALKSRLASIWRTPEELTTSLAVSIMKAKYEIPRVGWQRATDFDEASLRREISELQKENKQLLGNLKAEQEKTSTFVEQSNVAFENCKFNLKYRWSTTSNHVRTDRRAETSIALQDIFVVVATEMMDVSLIEDAIEEVIIQKFIGSSYTYSLDDTQLIKTVLNQLRVLGLIRSNWDEKKAKLYWGLTLKGKRTRDNLIVIRNEDVKS